MTDTPESACIPLMSPEKAQEIARGLKWLAQSYAEAGMARDAARAERESQSFRTLPQHGRTVLWNDTVPEQGEDAFPERKRAPMPAPEVKTYITHLLDIEDGLGALPHSVHAYPEIQALVDQLLAAVRLRLDEMPAETAKVRATWRPVERR